MPCVRMQLLAFELPPGKAAGHAADREPSEGGRVHSFEIGKQSDKGRAYPHVADELDDAPVTVHLKNPVCRPHFVCEWLDEFD